MNLEATYRFTCSRNDLSLRFPYYALALSAFEARAAARVGCAIWPLKGPEHVLAQCYPCRNLAFDPCLCPSKRGCKGCGEAVKAHAGEEVLHLSQVSLAWDWKTRDFNQVFQHIA